MNKRLNLQYCTSDFVLNTIYTEPLLMQYTIFLAYSVSDISVGSYAGTTTQQISAKISHCCVTRTSQNIPLQVIPLLYF